MKHAVAAARVATLGMRVAVLLEMLATGLVLAVNDAREEGRHTACAAVAEAGAELETERLVSAYQTTCGD